MDLFYLLGIDDTDYPNSEGGSNHQGGTSALALQLGLHLESLSLAKLMNVSCHSLWQHPSIQNSADNFACCLMIDVEPVKMHEVDLACRSILLHDCAPQSNPGYALASWNQFDAELVTWGKAAQTNLLERQAALSLGRKHGISMAGIFGSGMGVIGALAAVGLRFEGNDGWINWMPGLSAVNGVYTQAQLSQIIRFDRIESDRQKHPALDDRIQITAPARPVFKNGSIVLPITASKRGADFEWQAVSG